MEVVRDSDLSARFFPIVFAEETYEVSTAGEFWLECLSGLADLLDLADDHTEYFKSHLDALPAQERRVYLALAVLRKPANASEIADRVRLETSKCSAQLARLVDRCAVEVSGGSSIA